MESIPPELAIKHALSAPRIGTYEAATAASVPLTGALALYAWNAQVSAALMAPLHICEVVVRNAAADAIARVYGSNWPWQQVFVVSLPDPTKGYNPREELLKARIGQPNAGKVIPELKFIFWQRLFTRRFDDRIWRPHLRTIMPLLDPAKKISELRALIYAELDELRKLRNRIAHHEPIFLRNLADDIQKIRALIALRCPITSAWMMHNQHATTLMDSRPP